ncbi:putative hydrolase [Candidatus Terasakiella magnetica]|uniref:Putative hydrolase n=1 Tax=Candidatus Terasakiella magnetica TaxID=1867952 RepID=A0A1C3RC34_9PROT|nr:alpha/beta hydrolase [Candidatus Terasakiella magnetica]SCA54846.1 putative hydrolase [Candidatus Terasakiella magnetica]
MFKQKEPVSHYINVEGYEIHVTEWGVDNPSSILMWHGLARTGRDFDHLAELLSKRYRVLCPDTLGRGLSQWGQNPKEEYCFDFYEKIALKVCEIFGFYHFDYIGTSMGGALGMRLAGGPLRDNINRLVINDIAPQLAEAAVDRILTYAGSPPSFETIGQLEDYLQTVYEPYGYLTDEQWRLMVETSYRRMDNGQITLHYDPKMVTQFTAHPNDYDLWETYEKIKAETLVLRGAESDLLLTEWAQHMTEVGPKAHLIEIPGCGHAPALNKTQQTHIIEKFLEND